MTEQALTKIQANQQIIVEDGAELLIVRRDGTRVLMAADGSVSVFGDAQVNQYTVDSDEQKITEPFIGQHCEDGTIYAGISPETNRPFYVRPSDESYVMQWHEAMKYASKVQTEDGKKFRVPTVNELSELFKNKTSVGGFDKGAHRHWSSSASNESIHFQALQSHTGRKVDASQETFAWVRLVCD